MPKKTANTASSANAKALLDDVSEPVSGNAVAAAAAAAPAEASTTSKKTTKSKKAKAAGATSTSGDAPTTSAPATEGTRSAIHKRTPRGTFDCYIKRAVRNKRSGDLIYRMDRDLAGILDHLSCTYIKAAARETQSALDLMSLKQITIKSLKFALNRITPKRIMDEALAKMQKMSKLLDDANVATARADSTKTHTNE
jgi:hypothetical protein